MGNSGVDAPIELPADRYDGVIFDMDGVVTDTAAVHAAAWKHMFDDYLATVASRDGVPQTPFKRSDYLQYVDGKPREDGVASFLASRGIGLPQGTPTDGPAVESVWGLAIRKDRDFQRVLADHGAQAFPTSVALVEALKRAGVGTAIISASRHCEEVLAAAGIGQLFDARVDGVETARLGLPGKPSPAVFLEAARRLAVAPERAVVVEDAIAGVQAGRSGHFAFVLGVDRTGQAEALRANGADAVVSDLGEVQVIGRRR